MQGSTQQRTVAGPPVANPPALLPEAKGGFEDAQSFYRSILANPPIYGGPRVAGIPEGTQTGINQLYDIGAGGPTPEEMASRNLTFTTAGGGSLAANPYASVYDTIDPALIDRSFMHPAVGDFASGVYTDINQNPFFAGAQRNILDPIVERYNTQIRPNIRDRFITAGGEGSSREVLSEEQALREFGRGSTNALAGWEAGIYEMERALQQQAAIESSRLGERAGEVVTAAGGAELSRAGGVYGLERQLQEEAAKRGNQGTIMDLLRANTLIGAGAQERGFEQEQLRAMSELFEEPIYRQSAAAQSLMQAPTSAGYPSSQTMKGSEDPGAFQQILQLAMTAAMIYAAVAT